MPNLNAKSTKEDTKRTKKIDLSPMTHSFFFVLFVVERAIFRHPLRDVIRQDAHYRYRIRRAIEEEGYP
jgi:hypothetical protein